MRIAIQTCEQKCDH